MSIGSYNVFIKENDTYKLHVFGGFVFPYTIRDAANKKNMSQYDFLLHAVLHYKPKVSDLSEAEVIQIASAGSCLEEHKNGQESFRYHKFAGDISFLLDTNTMSLHSWRRNNNTWENIMSEQDQNNINPDKKHGFANWDKDAVRAASLKASRTVEKGNRFTSETARAAGAKAGHQHSREHMAALSKLAHAKRKANKKQAQPTAPEDPT